MKAGVIIKKLGCSQPFFNRVVRGEKNLGYKNAKRAKDLLGGSIAVWMDPAYTAERKEKYYKKRGIPYEKDGGH